MYNFFRNGRVFLLVLFLLQIGGVAFDWESPVSSFAMPNAAPMPHIISASGSLGKGGTLRISGKYFGDKLPASPMKWDDFESGAMGQRIGGKNAVIGGPWSDYSSGTTYPVYDNTQLRKYSARSSYHNYSTTYNVSLQEKHVDNTEWFFSFWYFTNQADSARQSKPWQLYGSSGDEPMTYMGWGQNNIDGSLRIGMMDGGGADPNGGRASNESAYGKGPSDIASVRNKWIRIDAFLKQSTGGAANGDYRVWLSNGVRPTWMALWRYPTKTRSSSNYWQQLMLGTYFGGGNTAHRVWIDDVYIDKTQARVEICDKSTWVKRTHCEIQTPITWSDKSISVRVNPGSYTHLRSAYVYVVDSKGNVNYKGYSLEGL